MKILAVRVFLVVLDPVDIIASSIKEGNFVFGEFKPG
jgi:hypothetical protein